MIPESQLLDALICQESSSRRVLLLLAGHPVFKAIQFYGEPSRRTVEIKKVSAERMLASELEARKAAGS